MTRAFTASFIFLAMIGILITAGCVSQPSSENLTGKTVSPTTTQISTTQPITSIQPVQTDNITQARNKVQGIILEILAPNYPEKDRRAHLGSSYVPVENAGQRFNLSNTTAFADGGEIFIQIEMKPSVSSNIVDSFMTQITLKGRERSVVEGWVGLNNIEKIAILSDVTKITLLHSGTTFS